jgi:hypothetical protein
MSVKFSLLPWIRCEHLFWSLQSCPSDTKKACLHALGCTSARLSLARTDAVALFRSAALLVETSTSVNHSRQLGVGECRGFPRNGCVIQCELPALQCAPAKWGLRLVRSVLRGVSWWSQQRRRCNPAPHVAVCATIVDRLSSAAFSGASIGADSSADCAACSSTVVCGHERTHVTGIHDATYCWRPQPRRALCRQRVPVRFVERRPIAVLLQNLSPRHSLPIALSRVRRRVRRWWRQRGHAANRQRQYICL